MSNNQSGEPKPEKDVNSNKDDIDYNIERDNKVNVYDDDNAYMLNDEKDNAYLEDDADLEFNVHESNNNQHNDSNEEITSEPRNNIRQKEEITDEETVRNKNIDSNNHKEDKYEFNEDLDRSKMSNLITLKYISVCQCCKENFNANTNVPYLLRCGHFFCRSCIDNNYTDEEGRVFCPDDGIVANSVKQLKLLNNLIIDKSIDIEETNRVCIRCNIQGFCEAHPGQKLSHFIEETKEIICVYCAFNRYKKNPKYEIKEIKEKCKEILTDVDKILGDNQHYVEVLQHTLQEIKDNKNTEEERVSNLYDNVIKFLDERRNEIIENINDLFAGNADKLSEKLDYFSSKMEDAEELKGHILSVMNNETQEINEVMSRYSQFVQETTDSNKLNLELAEYKFSHDDENKLFKYLSNFGDLKSKAKYIRFIPKNYVSSQQTSLKNLNSDLKHLNIASSGHSGQGGLGNNLMKNNYESNNHKYNNNAFQNELLNSSELNENEYAQRMNTQQKHFSNYIGDSRDMSKMKLELGNYSQLNTNPNPNSMLPSSNSIIYINIQKMLR